jgi:acyl-CoA synthetase (AMP-forming)/AMP-acid ligase II
VVARPLAGDDGSRRGGDAAIGRGAGSDQDRRNPGRLDQPRPRGRDLPAIPGSILEHLRIDGDGDAAVRGHTLRDRRKAGDQRQGAELAAPLPLVDESDEEVGEGEPGEVALRGPTLFSGYRNAAETNAHDFRNGWFHMGDVFRRRSDGLYDYVDRVKYLIKTGAENVYPAEIERVLMADPRVVEAVVVRRPDAKWGEVPVAFVTCKDSNTTAEDLIQVCGRHLARYKLPKEVRFVPSADAFPRSTSGKIQRQAVEKWLTA